MVLQLRFLVRCDEVDAIDEMLVVAIVAVSPMSAVENEDLTMNSMGYEDAEQISVAAEN